jgi:protein transport protein HofQ
MRRIVSHYLVAGILGFASACCAKPPEPRVSMEFHQAPIPLILQGLADHQQLDLIISDAVKGTLSLRLNQVPWQQALNVILRMGKLSSQRQGKVLLVFSQSEYDALQQRTEAAQVLRDEQQPLILKTIALQHAQVGKLIAELKAQKGTLLSARGSVYADSRTNTLFIRDTAQSMDSLSAWLQVMDSPLQQVQLTAYIITIDRDSLRELGVRWGLSAAQPQTERLRINQFSMGIPLANEALSASFNLARINGRILDLELKALEQEGAVEIIASPRLVTAHQQTASIKQGTEIPYSVSSGNNGQTAIEFKEAVLGMEVTPQVLHRGNVLLDLQITQNMPGRALKQAEGEVLAIDKQEVKTQVMVKQGETLVLGGIFQQHHQKRSQGVPGLQHLPWVGNLFKQHATTERQKELVIFITPTLLFNQS